MGRPKFDRVLARTLYDQRKLDYQIADKLGISAATVSNWRRSEGLPSWQTVDREAKRQQAQTADLIRQVTRDQGSMSIESAMDNAQALGLSYGQYMAARYEGRLPRRLW